MNHPSEWARFFDENTGSYRYKHKGSGVIRDTFMTIGKVFKDTAKNVAKKTTEKAGQKVGELAEEKTKTVVSRCKYFAKPNTKKIRRHY